MARNIVVGVDGSGDSYGALRASARLAEQTASRLSILFVRDPGNGGTLTTAFASAYEVSAEALIEDAALQVEALISEKIFDLLADRAVEWTFDTAAGDAAHMLVEFAKETEASLIVVGGRSHSLLGGLIVGSVAQKLLRSSQISVLVVRQPPMGESPIPGLETAAP
jgi:nucleotide-binding universal stress UspA family protein